MAQVHPNTTADGDHAIEQFTNNYPGNENVGQFYNGLTPQGYDEWARRVNFCEPYRIVDEVTRLIRDVPDSGLTETSTALDCGAGTGLLGLKLSEKGLQLKYKACDASS